MHHPRFPAHPSKRNAVATASLIAGLAGSLSLAACSETLRPLGGTPAAAEANAGELFDALSTRFSPAELSPKYDVVRVRLAQAALVPSRVFGDTSVWGPQPSPSVRVLRIVGGAVASGKYHLEIQPTLSPGTKPGDSRHMIVLEQLSNNEYRWDTDVALAIGGMTAEGMSVLISTLMRAPDGHTEANLRDDYRTAFPRATAAFGRGFSLDSLKTMTGALGTTAVTATVSFRPELMKPAYPNFAAYVDKYLGPAKYHFALADRSGAPLLDLVGRDRVITIKYRLQKGELTSLFGPPRAWGDSLLLTSDLSLHVKIFTVGFHGMVTDFVVDNAGHKRAWTVIAQREPKWDLPFITERLIRSPLRRPFEGAGTMFRLEVRDSAGTQSIFSRRTRLEVQESAIMRFIGSLVSHALGDLDSKVEAEEDRFLHDGFVATQEDVRALGARWK
ncbi:MAG: hypothetical protein ABI442_18705 [Gemmatimonadaceae bacterium]